jgi:hypothetical protein
MTSTTPRLLMAAVALGVVLTACGRSPQYQTSYSSPLPPRPAGCPDAAYEEQLLRTTGHLCPESERLANVRQTTSQEIFDLEVQQYGRHAVLECRSRMSWHAPTYEYCLEANRGR